MSISKKLLSEMSSRAAAKYTQPRIYLDRPPVRVPTPAAVPIEERPVFLGDATDLAISKCCPQPPLFPSGRSVIQDIEGAFVFGSPNSEPEEILPALPLDQSPAWSSTPPAPKQRPFSYSDAALGQLSFLPSLLSYLDSPSYLSISSPPSSNTGGINSDTTSKPFFYYEELKPTNSDSGVLVIHDFLSFTISALDLIEYTISQLDPSRLKVFSEQAAPSTFEPSLAIKHKLVTDPAFSSSYEYLQYCLAVYKVEQLKSSPDTFDLNTCSSLFSKSIDVCLSYFFSDLSGIISDLHYSASASGKSGYKYSGHLYRGLTQSGVYAYGGNSNTIWISLSGQGCSLVDMSALHDLIAPLAPRLTRIDLAYDDLGGVISHDHWMAKCDNGDFFASRGTNPNIQRIINSSPLGNTVNVGSLKNGKQICIYEKGKQLGDSSSPWVRVECRLRNVDRVIPLDVLKNPAPYFFGFSSALLCIKPTHSITKVDIVKKRIVMTVEHVTKYAKISYGKLLNFWAEMGKTPEQIFNMLVVDGTPRSLIKVSY